MQANRTAPGSDGRVNPGPDDSTVVLSPEIAVFVDDTSAAVPISILPTNALFLNSLIATPPLYIGSVGAPMRTFLLSDLLLDGGGLVPLPDVRVPQRHGGHARCLGRHYK